MEKQLSLPLTAQLKLARKRSDDAFRVLHGDAFDLFDQMPADSIDLVITSPPYWGHRDYGLDHNWELFNNIPKVRKVGAITPGYDWYRGEGGLLGLEPYPEWYVSHLAEILDKAAHCLKARGSLWINLGDIYFARWSSIREQGRQGLGTEERRRRKTPLGGIRQEKQLLLIPARFAIAMQSRGWILRNDVIWHKPNAVPRPEGDRLRNTHEHFFHFVKKPKQGRAKYHYELEHAEPRGNDVVVVNVAPGEGGHSATFPFDLIEPRIRTHRRPEARCWTRSAARGARSKSRRPWGAMSSASTHKASLWKFLRARLMAESSPGNFVSEWFGRRIDPTVRISPPDFEQSSKPSSRQQK